MAAPVAEEEIVAASAVPVYVWVNVPVPEERTRLLLFEMVTAPFDVNPDVAVMSPEMVGTAVHAVPVTVKFPPREVKLLPDTVKVLSKVVAPCRVKVPGVEVDPMVLIEEAPEPKVLVRDAPVPIVDAPEEVRVEKAPVPGVVDPMGPGAANVAPLRLDALIVPEFE